MFAVAWSLISMAHGLAHSWQAFAGLRGLLGFAEGSANPAGMKATAEWFPAQGARPRRRRLQHRRVGRLDARAAARRVGDSHLQLAGGVRDDRQPRSGLGRAVAAASTTRPTGIRALSAEERDYIAAGQEKHLQRRRHAGRRSAQILGQRNFWGIALPRFLADPTWGTLTFWLPLYLTHGAPFRSEADRALRVDAVPGRRLRLRVRRRRQPWAAEARRAQPDQRAPRRVHARRRADDRGGLRRASSRARTRRSRC